MQNFRLSDSCSAGFIASLEHSAAQGAVAFVEEAVSQSGSLSQALVEVQANEYNTMLLSLSACTDSFKDLLRRSHQKRLSKTLHHSLREMLNAFELADDKGALAWPEQCRVPGLQQL